MTEEQTQQAVEAANECDGCGGCKGKLRYCISCVSENTQKAQQKAVEKAMGELRMALQEEQNYAGMEIIDNHYPNLKKGEEK